MVQVLSNIQLHIYMEYRPHKENNGTTNQDSNGLLNWSGVYY